METVLLVRYSEIHLKGLNRPFFESKLVQNIRHALRGFKGITVFKEGSRVYVRGIENGDEDLVIDAVKNVFGVHSISIATQTEKDYDTIKQACVEGIKSAMEKNNLKAATFKVRARRSDKNFPINSMTMISEVGEYVLDNVENLTVDLYNPQIIIDIEVRENAYIYYDSIKAVGGMPIGTSKKATVLLSGGIDSPVASYMIAKRGVLLNAVHFHSFPYTSDLAKQKVFDLVKVLTKYCGSITVYVVNLKEIQEQIYEKCPQGLLTVLVRRFMMRIAEKIALKTDSKALITGESIGQVASQTLDAINATNAVASIPIFRPVIGFDKIDIMDYARQIGTYDISSLPYEDCCTVFVPKHPVTSPDILDVIKAESVLDVEGLIERAMQEIEIVKISD